MRAFVASLSVVFALMLACGDDGPEELDIKPDAGPQQKDDDDTVARCAGRCGSIISGGDTLDCGPCANRVFVTSTRYKGDLGGLLGADAKCQERANTAGLAGTYRAWLSSATEAAKDRFDGARGWHRVDGKPVADTISDFIAHGPRYPLNVDEFGDVKKFVVHTGTFPSGMATLSNCSGYTSNTGMSTIGIGATIHSRYTEALTLSCEGSASLYCLGIDLDREVPHSSTDGFRIAFISKGKMTGGEGLDGADSICNTEGKPLWPSRSFRAMLTTSQQPGQGRFDTTKPAWVRADGVRLVEQASDLGRNPLDTPLALHADGSLYRASGREVVWTGNSVSNCFDWKSSGLDEAAVGNVANWSTSWETSSNGLCNQSLPVYCFEE